MWIFMILMMTICFAQENEEQLDLSAIQDFEEKLPSYDLKRFTESEGRHRAISRRYNPTLTIVRMHEIKRSETEMGHMPEGSTLVRLEDGKTFKVSRSMFIRYFRLQDEQGHTYIQNKDGSIKYKTEERFINPIKQELDLYQPPLKYSPAPANLVRTEYDQELKVLAEASFYAGWVFGDYMRDLFNDAKADAGLSTQYGLHLFTKWKLPLQVGLVIQQEQTTYGLSGGGKVQYSSLSFGPQFKSKDFEMFGHAFRFQTQFRVGPYAKALASTQFGEVQFKFNSSDLLTSLEHPIHNKWGEFVLGLFFQAQWLSLRDQKEIVSVSASNEINKAFGLSFSQVFE